MNSWIATWTSREKGLMMACPSVRKLHSCLDSARTSLRLVQKTSGLFDSVNAGNMTVAGRASKLMGEMDTMDYGVPGLTPSMELGSVLGDMPLELTEADYLDSFMDLSNFLNNDESLNKALPTVSSDNDVENMKESVRMDFSGIISHLKSELPVTMETPAEVPSSTKVTLGKRKKVDILEIAMEESINVDTVETLVADHDYVAKKMKMTTPTVVMATTSTGAKTSSRESQKSTNRYRERRDKNNEASRRSRQIRKQKFVEMDKEAGELEVKNEVLRKKIAELEAMAKSMKAVLIQKMTTK